MQLTGILIGSADPARLVAYYTSILGEPGFADGGYTGWMLDSAWLTIGPHDQVKGQNGEPGRLIWNLASTDVPADFARFKAAGATVVSEPYQMGPGWIATFADADGNYFQLMSPMEM